MEISKTDITGDTEIPGAHLIIYDAEGNRVEEWISGNNPHIIEKRLIAGERYTLHEESAPDGYAYASDIVFSVSENGQVDKVVMKDETTLLEVRKTDEKGDPVAGAVLAITDSSGNEIIRWTTDGNGKEWKGLLNADTGYILREISAPEGYAVAADLPFRMPRSGERLIITMKDSVIKRNGGGGGEPLHNYQSPIKETEPAATVPGNEVDSDDRNAGRFHVTKILGAGGRRSPETGDAMPLGLFVGTFLLSGGILLGFLIQRKKNGKK